MARPARTWIAPGLLALAGVALLAWLGLATMAFTDYEVEAQPALAALRNGDVAGFLARLPAYGGSLVLRAPFALAPVLWGGGDLAVFRSMAAPCLAAGAALGVLLHVHAREQGLPRPAPLLALGLCAANPITLRALETGHPEELLGAAACVAAVLAAARERATWAGVLLGLAIANKPWAVLAVLPVMLALQRGHLRALMTAGVAAGLVLAPMLLGGAAGAESVRAVATAGGEIFQPWQIWWFAGEHGELVQGLTGAKPGYRTAPSWISGIGHPAVVLVGLALGAAGARRLRGGPPEQGLLLLALILLTRCLLDPWNTAYYALPFLLALCAWEVLGARRAPLLTLAVTLLTWVSFIQMPELASPDAQAAFYLAWSVPLAIALCWEMFGPERSGRAAVAARAMVARRLPTLVGAARDSRT